MSKTIDDNFWLDKIADSKYFNSVNDMKLLRYLVNSTREDNNLKETVIAIDVFGRDASFDPGSDSIVRSNIYNLRKKLDSYYLDEGANDEVRLVIPKGSYRVQFDVIENDVPAEEAPEPLKKNPKLFKILFTVATILMVLFAILYFSSKTKRLFVKSENANPIWEYYIHSKKPLIIVLGDYFIMQKAQGTDNKFSYIRDPEINSQNDYSAYLEKNPDQKASLKKLGQSYFGEEIPNCFYQILQIFQNAEKPVSMKYASQLTINDVRENDIIFVGDFATLGILNPFFTKSGYHFSILPRAIYTMDKKKDTTEYISLQNPNQSDFQNDYAVVSNVTAYDGKRILFIVSFLPFGKSEALYKLNESSFLNELTDTSSTDAFSKDWNLLMKISGLKSSGFYYEVLKFGKKE